MSLLVQEHMFFMALHVFVFFPFLTFKLGVSSIHMS